MNQLTATKSNLDEARRLLAFSRGGYRILDRKRSVLMREFMRLKAEALELAEQADREESEFYHAIAMAKVSEGAEEVENISRSVSADEGITVLRESVMGVELPRILSHEGQMNPSYSLYRSTESMDRAFQAALKFKQTFIRVLEAISSLQRLSAEIRKSGKRADSINKIQIPRYEAEVKRLSQALEEKDREDLFRLKRGKEKLASHRS